jgi:hypothetical protein
MTKILKIAGVLSLGACVYGSPVNYEKFYANSDITKVDWSKADGKGSSCQTNWLFGLLPAGSNSLASAVRSAGISKIAYVDTETVLYLPLLMTRECTNVYGTTAPIGYDFDDAAESVAAPKPVAVKKPAAKSAKAAAKSAEAKTESKSDYDLPAPADDAEKKN